MLVGYFNVFDFGLGRAITRRAVVLLEAGDLRALHAAVCTALLALLCLSTLATLALAALAPVIAGLVVDGPGRFSEEVTSTLRVLALSLPFVTTTVAFQGLLQAQGRFGLLNAVRAPTGVFTFVGPVLALPLGHDLITVVTVLVAGRAVACMAYLLLCLRTLPELRRRVTFDGRELRDLIGFGSWIALSGLVAPLLLYIDRFLVAALLSATALAYYATPYDAVMKLLLIAASMGAVLFPAFSASPAVSSSGHERLASRAVRSLIVVMFPIVLLLVLFAQPLLSVWLGDEFARRGYRVLQLLAVGVFVNSLATVPYSLIQAGGRPDVTAKLHIAELAPYVAALVSATMLLGIPGTALAWTLRVIFDLVLLILLAGRLGILPRGTGADLLLISAWPIPLLGLAMFVPASLRWPAAIGALALFLPVAWKRLLDARERFAIIGHLPSVATRLRR